MSTGPATRPANADYEDLACRACQGRWRWKVQFETSTSWACDEHLCEVLDAARHGWEGLAPIFQITARV